MPPPLATELDVICVANMTGSNHIDGYAYSPADLDRKLVIELIIDGTFISLFRADEFVEKLFNQGLADGCFGFSFLLPETMLEGVWELRLSNVQKKLFCSKYNRTRLIHSFQGEVCWLGRLRLAGFVTNDAEAEAITCVCDGRIILQQRALGWEYVVRAGQPLPVRHFEFTLPADIADGEPKQIHVYNAFGLELIGSPIEMVAFADPLLEIFSTSADNDLNDIRISVFERLFPHSVPFDEWLSWDKRWLSSIPQHSDNVFWAIVIIGDDYSLLSRTTDSLTSQTHDNWIAISVPIDKDSLFRSADIFEFLANDAAKCNAVLFVDNGTILKNDALSRLASSLNEFSEATIVYPDLYYESDNSPTQVAAFSTFDYERYLCQGYFYSVIAVRTDVLKSIVCNEISSIFDIVFMLIEASPEASGTTIVHLPGAVGTTTIRSTVFSLEQSVVNHLSRKGVSNSIYQNSTSSYNRLQVIRNVDMSSTSILITSMGDKDALNSCLTSIRSDEIASNFPIHVLTNTIDTSFLSDLDINILSYPGDFRRNRLLMNSLSVIDTKFVFTIDEHQHISQKDWLPLLFSSMHENDVAIVSPLTLDEHGLVTHAGYTLGTHYAFSERFRGTYYKNVVYGDFLNVAHEVTAVSLKCALLRPEAIHQAGTGGDYPSSDPLHDTDLGLRLQQLRWRTIMVPFVTAFDKRPPYFDLISGEDQLALANFRRRWGTKLLSDTLYNPTLSLDGTPYAGLAWPPRTLAPRMRFRGEKSDF